MGGPKSIYKYNILFNATVFSKFSLHNFLKAVIILQTVSSVNDTRKSYTISKPMTANYTLEAHCVPNKKT